MTLTPTAHVSSMTRWFAPTWQPIRRDFGLAGASARHTPSGIRQRDVAHWPFCALTEFSSDRPTEDRILVVAPLSGHFAFILREMVAGLVEWANVSVTDWLNARHIPQQAGEFGFDGNVDAILQSIRLIGPGAHVIAVCQGVMPALAATALITQSEPERAPHSLILIGGAVDPLANPTRVIRLLRQRPLKWLAANALDMIGPSFPGGGRLVYPGHLQFSALMAYFYRHLASGGELLWKMVDDDGIDPVNFPFMDLFISLMDLPAAFFLENIQKVFLDRDAWEGKLRWRGEPVDFAAVRDTALMTVEGAGDDIAAPGQTGAAHSLCRSVSADLRRRLVVPGAGHFSLFYGRTCHEKVLPEIKAFVRQRSGAGGQPSRFC